MSHVLNKRIRSFFAVDLNQGDSQRVAALMAPLKKLPNPSINWLPLASLHITLCFLGDIPLSLLPTLTATAEQQLSGKPAFSLTLNTLQYFPIATKPKVIALLPQPHRLLSVLAQLTRQSASGCGLVTDTRPYRPHLSLARIKASRYPLPPLAAITPISDIAINRVTLFQSAGALGYIPLARFALIDQYP